MFTRLSALKFLIVALFAINSEYARSKSERSSICIPREPIITFSVAVEIARVEVAKRQDLDKLFIDQVKLNCINGKAKWLVEFRRKEYESGHLIISIDMAKRINIEVVKDG